MKAKIYPSEFRGNIEIPSSKSFFQRLCALALLHNGTTFIKNGGDSEDEQAALSIIRRLGAVVKKISSGYVIDSSGKVEISGEINCGESGLCFRMFAPICALAGEEIILNGNGSLMKRSMNGLIEMLEQAGIHVSSNNGFAPLKISGNLKSGDITVNGSDGSQPISGLMIALGSIVTKATKITIVNPASKPYLFLTAQLMREFGYEVSEVESGFLINKRHQMADVNVTTEGDWSNAAFWCVAGAISGSVQLNNLNYNSIQGDKVVQEVLENCGADILRKGESILVSKNELNGFRFDATDYPDLFPPLVALALNCNTSSVIKGVHRLLNKESNRADALMKTYRKLGAEINVSVDEMIVQPAKLKGGDVNSCGDHRIAMSVAIAACNASEPVTIENAEAVRKSYPAFFKHLQQSGINVEIYE